MSFLKNISSSTPDDITLLQRYRQSGDIRVLAELYQRYMDLAYAVCYKYLKDEDSAKDGVMDVFEQLVVKLSKHDVSNFKSWLHTVVKNHCLMQLRSGKQNKSVALDESLMQSADEMHHEAIVEKEWQFSRMTKCIEGLSADQKKIIGLFYLQEKCYNEITSITGLEWNKVRSLVQNGRRNLKICMEQILSASGQPIKSKADE